jgi:hypothetical protein
MHSGAGALAGWHPLMKATTTSRASLRHAFMEPSSIETDPLLEKQEPRQGQWR